MEKETRTPSLKELKEYLYSLKPQEIDQVTMDFFDKTKRRGGKFLNIDQKRILNKQIQKTALYFMTFGVVYQLSMSKMPRFKQALGRHRIFKFFTLAFISLACTGPLVVAPLHIAWFSKHQNSNR